MNISRNSIISSPVFAPNKSRTNAGTTEKSTCILFVPSNYLKSKTKIGEHGLPTSAAHIKPCHTIRFNPLAGRIILPIWLRSKLFNLRNTLTQPLPLLPLNTRTPSPPQQVYLHLKRPLPDADVDVAMIEETLVVVDVAVALVVDKAVMEM